VRKKKYFEASIPARDAAPQSSHLRGSRPSSAAAFASAMHQRTSMRKSRAGCLPSPPAGTDERDGARVSAAESSRPCVRIAGGKQGDHQHRRSACERVREPRHRLGRHHAEPRGEQRWNEAASCSSVPPSRAAARGRAVAPRPDGEALAASSSRSGVPTRAPARNAPPGAAGCRRRAPPSARRAGRERRRGAEAARSQGTVDGAAGARAAPIRRRRRSPAGTGRGRPRFRRNKPNVRAISGE